MRHCVVQQGRRSDVARRRRGCRRTKERAAAEGGGCGPADRSRPPCADLPRRPKLGKFDTELLSTKGNQHTVPLREVRRCEGSDAEAADGEKGCGRCYNEQARTTRHTTEESLDAQKGNVHAYGTRGTALYPCRQPHQLEEAAAFSPPSADAPLSAATAGPSTRAFSRSRA